MTIYQRQEADKGYVAHLFHADRVAQSSEINEIQAASRYRLRRVADALFDEGQITEGARCSVNRETGVCDLEAGSIYLLGAVHDVLAASFVVPVIGTVVVGVRYVESVVTALEDPTLYSQAINTAGYGEPGADRLRVAVSWAVKGEGPQEGEFFPIWNIDDGAVRARDTSQGDGAIAAAIERYDVDSTGGTYAVRGLGVVKLPDADGKQVYSIAAGEARVVGRAVEVPSDRRVVYAAAPDVENIGAEPHMSTTDGLQRIEFDRWPVLAPAQLRVQRRRTVQINHGPYAGAADPLPNTGIISINTVKQGGTIYNQGADYKLTAGQLDWSPGGAEPAPGSAIDVTYEYISTEAPLSQDTRGFEVQGALTGTLVLVEYDYAMRRVDRIAMQSSGEITVIKGVSAAWRPVPPDVPDTLLPLASIFQTWEEESRKLMPDGVRMVNMQTMGGYAQRMDDIELDLAELRLATDVNGRYGGLKKGYFADPMKDNSMRDQGMVQTALIANGALQLDEPDTAHLLGDATAVHMLDYVLVPGLRQASASRAMRISTAPVSGKLPATATLTPAIDRWAHAERLTYPGTIMSVLHNPGHTYALTEEMGTVTQTRLGPVTETRMDPALLDTSGIKMRAVEVEFSVTGFQPLEPLQEVTFNGQPIVATPLPGGQLVADAQGSVRGKFTTPQGLPIGAKTVQFKGEQGSVGSAVFTASVTLKLWVPLQTRNYFGDYGGYGGREVTYVI